MSVSIKPYIPAQGKRIVDKSNWVYQFSIGPIPFQHLVAGVADVSSIRFADVIENDNSCQRLVIDEWWVKFDNDNISSPLDPFVNNIYVRNFPTIPPFDPNGIQVIIPEWFQYIANFYRISGINLIFFLSLSTIIGNKWVNALGKPLIIDKHEDGFALIILNAGASAPSTFFILLKGHTEK